MKKLVCIFMFLLCSSSISFAWEIDGDGNELLSMINMYMTIEKDKI